MPNHLGAFIDQKKLQERIRESFDAKIPSAIDEATGELVQMFVEQQVGAELTPMLGGLLNKAQTGGFKLDQRTAMPVEPKGLLYDPFTALDQMGFRERPTATTYQTLGEMARRTPPIAAIFQTRLNQVAAFARPQPDEHSVGTRIVLRDRKASMTPELEARADELMKWVMRCGNPDVKIKRPRFGKWVRQITWDSLVMDQMTTEIIPDQSGKPSYWRGLDASTIRISDDLDEQDDTDDTIQYVQVYDDTIIAEFTESELMFGVRNPRTDIKMAGYGQSELELLLTIITALLWGIDYNCICGETPIFTDKGSKRIDSLAGTNFNVWNGRAWREARAVTTDVKGVVRTKLWNGLESRTSQDHRFRIVGDDGEPAWAHQCDLEPGDHVLVGSRAQNDIDAIDEKALFVGTMYEAGRSTARAFSPTSEMVNDVEFWEMLGFALGDGYFPSPEGRDRVLGIFPRHTKDVALFGKFLDVCKRYGIHADKVTVNKTYQRVDGEWGCPAIQIRHTAFFRWLWDVGFKGSTGGKLFPSCAGPQPQWVTRALLRGLFSADGHTSTHKTGYRTPTVHSTNCEFRQTVLQALWSVGVATNEVGSGWDRCGELVVQDVLKFAEDVGYLQEYKSAGIERSEKSRHRWDRLAPGSGMKVADLLRAHPGWLDLSAADRGFISVVSSGRSRLSRPRAVRMLTTLGIEIPEELHYSHVPVDAKDDEPTHLEQMFDIEVFDDEHMFIGASMALHNSKFFKQGTVAKGMINFKGAIPDRELISFRRHWYSMLTGVDNAWRTPIVNADDVQWINMHTANKDMEFSNWMDWLLKVACAVYQIAPEEIGFQFGNTGQSSTMSEGSQGEKLAASKDKGLGPLVTFIADEIDKSIIEPLDDRFRIEFAGLNAQTAVERIDLQTKEIKSLKTVNEARAERDLDPLPDGDIILDPTYLQYVQGKQGMEGGDGAQLDDRGLDPQDDDGAEPGTPGTPDEPADDQAQDEDGDGKINPAVSETTGVENVQKSMRILDLEVDL